MLTSFGNLASYSLLCSWFFNCKPGRSVVRIMDYEWRGLTDESSELYWPEPGLQTYYCYLSVLLLLLSILQFTQGVNTHCMVSLYLRGVRTEMIISLQSIIITQGTQTGPLWWPRSVRWVGGGRKAQEGRDICVPKVDPCWCTAETNTIL